MEEEKGLNHFIHVQEQIIHLLKCSEDQDETSNKEKKDLCQSDSRTGFLYMGLLKFVKY